MDDLQIRNWIQDIRPTSATSLSFENVPLTPRSDETGDEVGSLGPADDEVRSSDGSSGFFHVPLEHEIIAARSAWDDSTAEELSGQHDIFSTRLARQYSSAAAACTPSEYGLTAVGNQACLSWEVLGEQEERGSTSAVVNRCSDDVGISDPLTPSTESAVTLVEMLVALGGGSGAAVDGKKVSSSTDSPRDENWGPTTTERDISDEVSRSSNGAFRSKKPSKLTISIPPFKSPSHAIPSRTEKPETSTPASVFEIPIPIFPFPAGTTRCTNRTCPIKHRHERGPYLHAGKLRTREGAIFGSSNPPPEIWFLYDCLSKSGDVRRSGDEAFAPVEGFVRVHFGETRGAGGRGVDGGGKKGEMEKERQGGGLGRFLGVW